VLTHLGDSGMVESMSGPRVLQIGIDPAVVDFSPFPGQTAEKLQARIEAAEEALRTAGFDVVTCTVPDDPDVAEKQIRTCLTRSTFDVVEIGSGLRNSHGYTEIFERAVNAVAELQPGSRFCFNDSPESTLQAVRRVISS